MFLLRLGPIPASQRFKERDDIALHGSLYWNILKRHPE